MVCLSMFQIRVLINTAAPEGNADSRLTEVLLCVFALKNAGYDTGLFAEATEKFMQITANYIGLLVIRELRSPLAD